GAAIGPLPRRDAHREAGRAAAADRRELRAQTIDAGAAAAAVGEIDGKGWEVLRLSVRAEAEPLWRRTRDVPSRAVSACHSERSPGHCGGGHATCLPGPSPPVI